MALWLTTTTKHNNKKWDTYNKYVMPTQLTSVTKTIEQDLSRSDTRSPTMALSQKYVLILANSCNSRLYPMLAAVKILLCATTIKYRM